jgi:hypothetical protein
MKTIEIKIYTFDELSDIAKERAREWYREGALDYKWWDYIYDDAATIGLKLTSFDLDRNRRAEGLFTESPETVAAAIIENHGEACETYRDAKEFQRAISVHSSNMDHVRENASQEFLYNLLEDYSIMLQREYEYILSDESVDENIRANGYTFREDGKREG